MYRCSYLYYFKCINISDHQHWISVFLKSRTFSEWNGPIRGIMRPFYHQHEIKVIRARHRSRDADKNHNLCWKSERPGSRSAFQTFVDTKRNKRNKNNGHSRNVWPEYEFRICLIWNMAALRNLRTYWLIWVGGGGFWKGERRGDQTNNLLKSQFHNFRFHCFFFNDQSKLT